MGDAVRVGPLAAKAIRATGIAFDHKAEMELCVQTVERCIDEISVGKLSSAADQDSQYVLGFIPQLAIANQT